MHVCSAMQASAAVATAVGAAAAAPPGDSGVAAAAAAAPPGASGVAAAAASWVATWPPPGLLTVRIGEIFVTPVNYMQLAKQVIPSTIGEELEVWRMRKHPTFPKAPPKMRQTHINRLFYRKLYVQARKATPETFTILCPCPQQPTLIRKLVSLTVSSQFAVLTANFF